jgi:carboxypeptidase Q
MNFPGSSLAGVALFLFAAITSPAQDLAGQYREKTQQLIQAAMTDEEAWDRLQYLCDRIGHRLAGSEGLRRAVEWSEQEMRRAGLENVRAQPVKVPVWVRGKESAELLEPVRRPLFMLGLGGSVGTPRKGIEAEVIPVSSYDELAKLGESGVRGKIVLYNVPFTTYGRTVTYRSSGASRAAQLGAVAVLVRSVTPRSLQTPHTGALSYAGGISRIPAAAVTLEDATLMQRLHDSGSKVRVRLRMEAKSLPDADSANVMGEIRGREVPEEVVVLGGHLDSWDVGQGAHDDGAGCIASLQAVILMKKLGFTPRRTVRVVFWTNEENGLRGGRAYRDELGDAVGNHVAAIEMDAGAERPVGFGVGLPAGFRDPSAAQQALARIREIARLLEPIGASEVNIGGGGADISPLMAAGVPGLGLRTVGEHYFDWHHTHADTLDKVNPEEFRKTIAAMAVMTYILADMPERLLPARTGVK